MLCGGLVAVIGAEKDNEDSVATEVDGALGALPSDVWMLSAGVGHSLAIKADGTLWAWGYNTVGQLGLGDTIDRNVPTQIGTDTDWVSVKTGFNSSFAIKTDGTLWAWGSNNYGQLGLGDTIDRNVPTYFGADTDWKLIMPGGGHSLAIKTDGTLWAWGSNNYGQLGLGDTTNRNIPMQIVTDTDWTSVEAGNDYSFAIKTDGTLWAWGSNNFGQLGNGSSGPGANKNVPVQVGADTDWRAVSCRIYHAIAIKTDGTLWAWGSNNYGQLGLGDTTNRFTPAQIVTDTDWTSVEAGNDYSFAIKTDGTLWAWGNNVGGKLGLGDATNRNVPTQIGIGTDWVAVVAGSTHSLALKTDGTLWAWGSNNYGQLGLGDTTNRHTPMQVGTDDDWYPLRITSSPITTVTESNTWKYTPITVPAGATISVTGASWLSSDGTMISGTAPMPSDAISEDFHITVTASKAGYADATQELTITVVASQIFTVTPTVSLVITQRGQLTFDFDLSGSSDYKNLELYLGNGITLKDYEFVSSYVYPAFGTYTIVATATNPLGNDYVTETITLAPLVITHSVTFTTSGGSSVPYQIVTDGSTVIKPADPVRAGYDFGGWYTDASLTVAYNFAAPVTSNLTLYAAWSDGSTGPGNNNGGSGGQGWEETYHIYIICAIIAVTAIIAVAMCYAGRWFIGLALAAIAIIVAIWEWIL